MSTPAKPSKKSQKKPTPAKTSFTSPFEVQWSPLPQEDMYFILKTLQDALTRTGLQKKETKVFRPWKRKHKKDSATQETVPAPDVNAPEETSTDDPVQNPADTPMENPVQNPAETPTTNPVRNHSESTAERPPKNGWTDVAARRQLAIGINEVTKALERNELSLVLVCKSVKPKHMTDHLITLSVVRGVPACLVPRLSQSLSEPLGLKSVLALGFRRSASKSGELFADTIATITPRVPPLDVPWLQDTVALETPDEKLVSTKKEGTKKEEEEEEKRREEKKDGSSRKGQKRKHTPEEAAEGNASCKLLPLKVKRIVANPARQRKAKKKKAK